MEGKKNVNVSTILLVISIIVIIIMGSCLYILYEQRNDELSEEGKRPVVYDENTYDKNATLALEEYIGTWEDEYDGSQIIIKSINSNRMLFDVNIVRIGGYENLVGEIKSDSLVIFNTNNTDTGEFWEGVYGTLTFQEDKVILEITESECEYVNKGLKIEGVNNKKKYSNTLKEMEYYTESYLYKNEENGTEIETLLPPNEHLYIKHMEKDSDGNIVILGDVYTTYSIPKKELEDVKKGGTIEFGGIKYKYEIKEFTKELEKCEDGLWGIIEDTGEILVEISEEDVENLKKGETLTVNIGDIEYKYQYENGKLKYKEGCFISTEDEEDVLVLGYYYSEIEEYQIIDKFEVCDESGEYLFMGYVDYFWTGKTIKTKVNENIKNIGLTWVGGSNYMDFFDNKDINSNIKDEERMWYHYEQYKEHDFAPIEHFNFVIKDGEIVEYWRIRSDYMPT